MTIEVQLTESDLKFIRESVASGEFGSENEVVQAALNLLKDYRDDYQEKMEALRAEIQKGFDDAEAGRFIELNSPEEIDAYVEDVYQRGRERRRKDGAPATPDRTSEQRF